MIRASRSPFNERTLELSVDPDTALSLHGELVSVGFSKPLRPNMSRLLAILERHLVNGDISEFSS